MLFYSAKDLAAAFRTVRANTIQIAEDIPAEQYGFVPAPGTMAVGAMLAHVALSPRFQYAVHGEKRATTLAGFDFAGLMAGIAAEAQKAVTKDDVITLLKAEGERFASWVEGLSDDFLAERVGGMTGSQAGKSRLEMLMGVKEHEMHHRGQLMLVERLLGIVPHLTRDRQRQHAARTSASR